MKNLERHFTHMLGEAHRGQRIRKDKTIVLSENIVKELDEYYPISSLIEWVKGHRFDPYKISKVSGETFNLYKLKVNPEEYKTRLNLFRSIYRSLSSLNEDDSVYNLMSKEDMDFLEREEPDWICLKVYGFGGPVRMCKDFSHGPISIKDISSYSKYPEWMAASDFKEYIEPTFVKVL